MTHAVSDSVVLFAVGDLNLALKIEAVERVERSVEIAPLPEAMRGVLGVVNMRGRIMPVFDLRARFGMPEQQVRASDYLVIARMRSNPAALLVNAVLDVVPGTEARITQSSEVLPDMECISGVMKLDGDLVFVHDLERFLSNEDYAALQLALSH